MTEYPYDDPLNAYEDVPPPPSEGRLHKLLLLKQAILEGHYNEEELLDNLITRMHDAAQPVESD